MHLLVREFDCPEVTLCFEMYVCLPQYDFPEVTVCLKCVFAYHRI